MRSACMRTSRPSDGTTAAAKSRASLHRALAQGSSRSNLCAHALHSLHSLQPKPSRAGLAFTKSVPPAGAFPAIRVCSDKLALGFDGSLDTVVLFGAWHGGVLLICRDACTLGHRRSFEMDNWAVILFRVALPLCVERCGRAARGLVVRHMWRTAYA